ncbi:ATP-binding protein [Novosphingobium sp.]|uniref:sensor histidine kinase n=1 Tax=Novosphingobium sp. TaxID=1874826 RepID=UPI00286E5D05|nr:ATP-binding protein [Novosphingobium sp.]
MNDVGGAQRARGVNWRQVVQVALAILAAQAIYWLIIDKHLFKAPPPAELARIGVSRVELAKLPEPSLAAAANAVFKPAELPFSDCCTTASFAARLHFKLDVVPEKGLGVLSTLQVDNYILQANGSTIVAEGRMTPGRQSFHGQKTFLTRIPAGVLRTGDNELTYITLRDGFPYTDINPPLIAEYDALSAYSAQRLWIMGTYPLLSGLVLGILGLFGALMVSRSDDKPFAVWLSLLCAAWAGYALYGALLDPPFDGWVRMMVYFALILFIPVALLCFVDSWTRAPVPYLRRAAVAAYAAMICAVAWLLFKTPMPGAFDVPVMIWIWALMGFALLTLARILWHFARIKEDRVIESAIMSVCVVAVLMDGLGQWAPELGAGELNLMTAAPFLMLAMVAAFLARNFRLFQSQSALNATLQKKVALREAELAESHAREQKFVAEQAHEAERRRIMQDIHDGLGSQLMSMMLSARLGEAEPAKVAEGLQAVIDEMRLMIDSMDSVGESLEAALATFRARVQPRVVEAGFAFDWSQSGPIDLPGYGPRDVLQIFRILQEAVTNALKHSGGTAIRLAVRQEAGGAGIIGISDNGRGGAQPGEAGRGLANMQNRARAVKADYNFESVPGKGTQIILVLPYHGIGSAQAA